MGNKKTGKVSFDRLVKYIGRRLSGGKLVQVFIDEDGERSCFTGIKLVFIGNFYKISSDGRISRAPEWTGATVPHDEQVKLVAEEMIDLEKNRERLAKRKFEKDLFLLKDLDVLAKRLREGFDYYERRHLLEYVLSRSLTKGGF